MKNIIIFFLLLIGFFATAQNTESLVERYFIKGKTTGFEEATPVYIIKIHNDLPVKADSAYIIKNEIIAKDLHGEEL